MGSSGVMPVRRETLAMYAYVSFSLDGAHLEMMPRRIRGTGLK